MNGTNGVLELRDIHLIIAEVELEQAGSANPASFGAGPFLVHLPLDGGGVTIATNWVPNGTYSELEFEVEDLEDDDSGTSQAAQAILTQIRQAYP